MKIYGRDNTHLTLSKKAEGVYCSGDVIDQIVEHLEMIPGEDHPESGYTYDVKICGFWTQGLTEDELNALIEGYADGDMSAYHWTLESWGSAYPPENASEIVEWANGTMDRWLEECPEYAGDEHEKGRFSGALWENYCWYDDTVREIIGNRLFNQAANLMDDDIREAVHADFAPCSDYIFLLEYMIRHSAKYGEDFTI